MRLVVCDDDPGVRAAVTQMAEDHGYVVVAHASNSLEAIEALERYQPDVIVLDLSLQNGTGVEVLGDASKRGCRVIIFSSFLDDVPAGLLPDGTLMVSKPEFLELDAALIACASEESRGAGRPERRSSAWHRSDDRPIVPVDDPYAFYEALARAEAGDALVALEVAPHAIDPDALARTVRSVVRAHDLVLRGDNHAQVLLIAGNQEGAESVLHRVERVWNETGGGAVLEAACVVIGVTEPPVDAFERLKAEPLASLTSR
jgi:hypothetical protein